MKKWFNTNYHYMVPEIDDNTEIKLAGTNPFDEFAEAKALGITTKPVIIGAFTLLKLLRYVGKKQATDYADAVSAAYAGSYGSVPRVYANTNFYQIREIESLSEQVLYQKVPYGTRYQDLEMPDSIDVFVSGGGKMKMCLTQGAMRM